MPTPLPDAERRRLVQGLLDRNIPPERIKQIVDEAEGYGPPSVPTSALLGQAGLAVPPSTSAPVGLQEQKSGEEFFTRTLPRSAAVMGAGLLASPFTAGMSLPLVMGAEGLAAVGGDLGYQSISGAIRGEPIRPKESLKVGLTTAGTAGLVRGGMDAFANASQIAPQFVRYFRDARKIGRFNRTMMEAPKEAEFQLGEEIKQAVQDWRSTKTAPRMEKEAILDRATQGGTKIHSKPVIDALEDVKLATPKTPTGDKLNAELTKIQDGFKEVRTVPAAQNVGNTFQPAAGKIVKVVRKDLTPKELDEFLTREIDNRIYKLSGSPKNQALAESLANARGKVREALLSALPKEAREATAAIYEELTKREVATKAISPTLVSLETKMRNLFKPGHQAEINALKTISESTGLPLHDTAFKLAQKRAFSPDPRIAKKEMSAAMWLIKNFMARPGLKIAAPLQSLAAPAAGAVRAGTYEERQRRKQAAIGPNP